MFMMTIMNLGYLKVIERLCLVPDLSFILTYNGDCFEMVLLKKYTIER